MIGEIIGIGIIVGFALVKLTVMGGGRSGGGDAVDEPHMQTPPARSDAPVNLQPERYASHVNNHDQVRAAPIAISRAGGGRFHLKSGRARIGY